MSLYDRPLPIRRRQNGWEVAVLLATPFGFGGFAVTDYILCQSAEDARAVADMRPLIAICLRGHQCCPARARRCVHALAKYGWVAGDRTFIRRLIHLAAR